MRLTSFGNFSAHQIHLHQNHKEIIIQNTPNTALYKRVPLDALRNENLYGNICWAGIIMYNRVVGKARTQHMYKNIFYSFEKSFLCKNCCKLYACKFGQFKSQSIILRIEYNIRYMT